MVVEEKLKSKTLYKLELYLLKMIPIVISILYFINIILTYIDIHIDLLSMMGGMSILPWLFLYLSSFVFKLCIYHRLFLYYILTTEIISWYDYKVGIPLEDKYYIYGQLSLFIITLLLVVYFKFKK